MRAARAQQIQMPQSAKKALLMVRKGEHTNARLPLPKAGKRQEDRAHHAHRPVQRNNARDPRAFIQVRIGARRVTALIDPGSVRSYLDRRMSHRCREDGWQREEGDEVAILADGSEVPLGDRLTGNITAAGLTIPAEFLELPSLKPVVLLGMDVLSKLRLQMILVGTDITPGRNKDKGATFAISGPIPMTDLEKEKQTQAERFLEKHLGRFNQVRGTTTLIEHQIVLEDPTLVKQRYRQKESHHAGDHR